MLNKIGAFLSWFLVWLGMTLLISSIGIRVFFGKITIDQLVLNLVAIRSEGSGESGLVWLAIGCIVLLPTAATAGLALLRARRLKRLPPTERWNRRMTYGVRFVAVLLTSAVVIGGASAFRTTVRLGEYISAGQNPVDMDRFYTQPVVVDDSHQRNLITIYLESGEAALGDEKSFEKNVFAPLENETQDWESIDGYQQYLGGGWTMAGLVSTQCGVPLKGKVAAAGIEIFHELIDGLGDYLPNLTCLGDVFKAHGYHSVFMGGANPAFAAKDKFLTGHGYDEEYGLSNWQREGDSPDDMRADWGLSDQRLFEHAMNKVDDLHERSLATGQPFNLTLLTLDTHEPVHVYDYCKVDTVEPMASIYSCSMTQVAGFVHHLREQGYLQDTAVVIMGDHLKQLGVNGAFTTELAQRTDRSIYNRIWIPEDVVTAKSHAHLRKEADQLSMYATLLEAAGLRIEGHQAGLGTSALSARPPYGPEQSMDSQEKYRRIVASRSDGFYRWAWGEG